MDQKSMLTGRVILLAHNDRDMLDTMAEQLDMCLIHKANDCDSAMQYLLGHTYDFVVLGMEGRDLSELLETCVMREFRTVLLIPTPIPPEALQRCTNLETLYFCPKEKVGKIRDFLEDILLGLRKPGWRRLLERVDIHLLRHVTPHHKNAMI